MRVAWALVSFALVATTPIVVFSPARAGRNAEPDRRIFLASANVLSGLRTPATTLPVDGSTMSPTAFTATIAATTRPFGSTIAAEPMPALVGLRDPAGKPSRSGVPLNLPTVAPAPAPIDPSCTGF